MGATLKSGDKSKEIISAKQEIMIEKLKTISSEILIAHDVVHTVDNAAYETGIKLCEQLRQLSGKIFEKTLRKDLSGAIANGIIREEDIPLLLGPDGIDYLIERNAQFRMQAHENEGPDYAMPVSIIDFGSAALSEGSASLKTEIENGILEITKLIDRFVEKGYDYMAAYLYENLAYIQFFSYKRQGMLESLLKSKELLEADYANTDDLLTFLNFEDVKKKLMKENWTLQGRVLDTPSIIVNLEKHRGILFGRMYKALARQLEDEAINAPQDASGIIDFLLKRKAFDIYRAE